MVKVSYNPGCRLGNHLFLYAAGRLLSQRLGLSLQAQPLSGFTGSTDVVPGETILNPIEVIDTADPIPTWPNVEHLTGKGIVIKSGFVNSRYFMYDRDIIKTWLALKPSMSVDADDVLINVRLGDFVPLGLVLDPAYYTSILERLKFRNLYLMTDDPCHPYLDMLWKCSPRIIHGAGVEHFRAALSFKRIIMSNSTFCWWFTFLSDAREIYLPMLNGGRCGSWCVDHLPQIDLRLDLPGVTHVYNIPSRGETSVITDAQRIEAMAFGKTSKALFL